MRFDIMYDSRLCTKTKQIQGLLLPRTRYQAIISLLHISGADNISRLYNGRIIVQVYDH